MRCAGVYLIQVQIKSIKFAVLPQGDISITLRVGRNSAVTNFANPHNVNGELSLNTLIQLNVDSTALEAQRCSITFNSPDKRILGIALISIPKDKKLLQSTYRLTQNEDKRAEVDIRLKINPFDSTTKASNNSQQILSDNSQHDSNKLLQSNKNNDIPFKIYVNNLQKLESSSNHSIINGKSKISEIVSNIESEDKKISSKNFKVRQQQIIIKISEKELKQYKDEKQAYYQLYQIQKGKNQIAAKFINNFLKKVGDKFPEMVAGLSPKIIESKQRKNSLQPTNQKIGLKKNNSNQHKIDEARVQQLEQANRTLHRQVQQYKKIVQKMKTDLEKDPPKGQQKSTNNFIFPGLLDLSAEEERIKQRSTIRAASKPPKKAATSKTELRLESEIPDQLKNIDFKKWIDLSIFQREAIQNTFEKAIRPQNEAAVEKTESLIKKLKTNLDRSFAALLSKKQLTKDALLSHKKEINKYFEEVVCS